MLIAGSSAADELPEELPPATDLHAKPTLSYLGKDKGYSYGVRVTFEVPRDELTKKFASGGGLDPFDCALEQKDGDSWIEAVAPTFCDASSLGFAGLSGLEPDTVYQFRVVLYQDEGDNNQNWIRKSPPSETVSVRTLTPGTPSLTSTCALDFALDPSDGTVPLRWQLEAGALVAESFDLERTDQAGGPWSSVATVPAEDSVSQKYEDEGLETDAYYYYRVRANYEGGAMSEWSNVVKERASQDKDWCDTDRAAHDGAADAVNSDEWPGTDEPNQEPGSGGTASSSGGAGSEDPALEDSGSHSPGGLGGAGSGQDGASGEGCSCQLPGGAPTTGTVGWSLLLLGGLLMWRRRGAADCETSSPAEG